MTLRGALPQFPLDTVLMLLAETKKSGQLSVRGDEGAGTLWVSDGRLVSAQAEGTSGVTALGAIFGVLRGGFEFESRDYVSGEDLSGELDELLASAVAERDRIAQVREVIPNERIRFRLSERAAQGGQIVLSPDQWRALLAAEGDRDVTEIAERISRSRAETAEVLAGLVRAGMIDTVAPPEEQRGEGYASPALLSGELAEFPLETVVQLVGATRQTGRIEVRAADASASLGMSDGRLLSASSAGESGELALANALTARAGHFEFVGTSDVGADLSGETIELLERAVATRDRLADARELIPDARSRLVLSDRAGGQEQITLTADQWRALTRIDGRRDLGALASEIHMGTLRTTLLVADLVRGGLVEVGAPAEPEPVRAPVTEIPPPPPPVEVEEPLAATPVDEVAQEAATDDRLAALTGLFGTPAPVEPVAPPAAEPTAETASAEWTTPSWEVPTEAPAEEPVQEIDPRLAAFGAMAAPPVEERVEEKVEERAPEIEAPPRPAPLPGTMGAPIPRPEPLPGTMGSPTVARPATPAPAPVSPAAPVAEKKKGGLFGFGTKAETPVAAPTATGPRSAQLARFANELVAGYNSGQYGKARIEDHMLSLLMRVDEQADPIDRPVPLANDRIDVDSIERGAIPEPQAVPYLALLVRQIYDDAERALGKDKARKGFKDTRDRIFGKDLSLFQAPDVASRLPKV